MRLSFRQTAPPKYAQGSKYGPLLSDGFEYLCPECGGHMRIADNNNSPCEFCRGKGTLSIDDARITDLNLTIVGNHGFIE